MTDQMEIVGEDLSLELTDNCRSEGLGFILSMLASEEEEQLNTIAVLRKTYRKLFAGEDKSSRQCE